MYRLIWSINCYLLTQSLYWYNFVKWRILVSHNMYRQFVLNIYFRWCFWYCELLVLQEGLVNHYYLSNYKFECLFPIGEENLLLEVTQVIQDCLLCIIIIISIHVNMFLLLTDFMIIFKIVKKIKLNKVISIIFTRYMWLKGLLVSISWLFLNMSKERQLVIPVKTIGKILWRTLN